MEKMKLFSPDYVVSMQKEVKAGRNLDSYTERGFDYERTKVKEVEGFEHIEAPLQAMLDAQTDFDAARILYEAYEQVPFSIITNNDFWIYLAHTELYQYVWKDAHKDNSGELSGSKILERWFFGQGAQRNTLASLWWAIRKTIIEDETGDARYEWSKVFMGRRKLYTRSLGASAITNNRVVMRATLRFIQDNADTIFKDKFEEKTDVLTKHINRLCVVKMITSMTEEDVYKELRKMSDKLYNVQSRKLRTNDRHPNKDELKNLQDYIRKIGIKKILDKHFLADPEKQMPLLSKRVFRTFNAYKQMLIQDDIRMTIPQSVTQLNDIIERLSNLV